MKDKVMVITGASAGIGAALAALVSQRGAKTVLLARREDALQKVAATLGASALPLVVDVTRRDEVNQAVAKTLAHFGAIDVWVNNAGRGISRMPSELTDQDLDDMMSANVKSVLYGMQAVLPHFKARGEGHIINISSMLGRVPFATIRSAYCAAKHAMNSLTASFRMELNATHPNLKVSCVHPGVVATDFGKNALHGGPDSRQIPGAQSVEEVAEVIASVIEDPKADVYTRPGAQQAIVSYYAAEDMGRAEQQPPFVMPRPPR